MAAIDQWIRPAESRPFSFTRHPRPNVRRTVPKDDAVVGARAKKTDDIAVDQDDVLEIQHATPPNRFRAKEHGQLADVVGPKSTAHRHDDIVVCRALNFQH
jgi:hypothetical protein